MRLRAEWGPSASNSAAAGAIWDPIYANHSHMAVWAARTYDVFAGMAKTAESGVHLVDGVEASRHAIAVPKWATRLPGFRICIPADLPPGFVSGWRYRAPIIDMPRYLDGLFRRLQISG